MKLAENNMNNSINFLTTEGMKIPVEMNLSIIKQQNSPPGFFIEIPTTFLICLLIGPHSKYTNYDTTIFLQPKVTLTALKIDLTSFFLSFFFQSVA